MITKKLWFLFCVLPIVLAGPYPNFRSDLDFVTVANGKAKEWWETGNFYQIYPRSFKDSDGDGVGDLKGITEKLPYLKEIGVTGAWLSPIFKSPMKDFGYDISNFYEIHEEYGNMKDFDNMIKKANELGIKIILDFVPNHTSDQSEWFKKSENKDPKYKDFYVWQKGRADPNDPDKLLPPNNWVSVFRKSAWEYSAVRKEFYLHQFTKEQPDLNYRNPAVQEEMKKVLRFWLDKGVYGYRIDAVPHLVECMKAGKYPDEPINPGVNDKDDYGYLIHDCTKDQPETLERLYEWRAVLDEYKNKGLPRILMAEAWSPIDILMKYYGDGDKKEGSQIPFNFLFITNLDMNSNAEDFSRTIHDWLGNMPKGRTANWVMGNHDKSRVATRFGEDRIDLLSIILQTLPGVSVTYNGEEIGMTDVWISWEKTVDPAACNSNKDIYELFTRDPERTPFQWSDEKNAGFSTGLKTWLPVADNYKEVNVKVQRGVAKSHLNTYKRLQELRKTKTLKNGGQDVKALNRNVLGILRSLNGEPSYLTLANIGGNVEVVDLSAFDKLPDNLTYEIVGDRSPHRIGERALKKSFVLLGNEAVVLKATPASRTVSLNEYYAYETAA